AAATKNVRGARSRDECPPNSRSGQVTLNVRSLTHRDLRRHFTACWIETRGQSDVAWPSPAADGPHHAERVHGHSDRLDRLSHGIRDAPRRLQPKRLEGHFTDRRAGLSHPKPVLGRI